jgi:hypothetical protein
MNTIVILIKVLKAIASAVVILASIFIVKVWRRKKDLLEKKRIAERNVRLNQKALERGRILDNKADYKLTMADKAIRVDETLDKQMQQVLVVSTLALAITEILLLICDALK